MLLEIRFIRVISRKEGLQRLGSTGLFLISVKKIFLFINAMANNANTSQSLCNEFFGKIPFTFSKCFSSAQDLNSFFRSFSYFRAQLLSMNLFFSKYLSGESFLKKTQNNKLGSPSRSILWTVSMKKPLFETLWNLVLLQLAFQDKKKKIAQNDTS